MASNALFEIKERKFYKGTPYFSETVRINLTTDETIDISIVVNSISGYVNLSKFYRDLQLGIGVDNSKVIQFSRWKFLLESLLYIDSYSLLQYGHLHFSFRGNHIYNTDEKITKISQKYHNSEI